MTRSFSQRSRDKLNTVHSDLQKVAMAVIKIHDCTVITGYRSEQAQNDLYYLNKSKKVFPHSKHNKMPSLAIDLAPYPIQWDNIKRFYYFAGLVIATAEAMGIKLRWGGDWDSDNDLDDQDFNDLIHFELQ